MLESRCNDDLNYMNLYDHPGPSGVPLGSIGTGYFSIAPDGNINRAALNDTFTQHLIRDIKGSFFAVYEHNLSNNAKNAYRMVRDDAQYCSMRGYEHTFYRGMYPFAGISFGKDELLPETRVTLEAFSPIISHNIKDSSLPVAFFEVHLKNPSGGRKNVSIAFSWEDLLGRHVFDIKDEKFFDEVKENTYWAFNAGHFDYRERIQTFAESWEDQHLKGVEISIEENIQPRKDTFQNYTNGLLVLAEKQPGVEISMLSGYEVDNADVPWQPFIENGKFPEEQFRKQVLYEPAQNKEKAVAVCVNAQLDGGEKRVLRFMVSWYIPKLETDRPGRHPFASFPSTDYNRYFHNYFDDIEQITEYCHSNRQRLKEQTRAWQEPILRSTYPEWLKFKIINSGYVLTTSSILNQNGDFTIVEGGGWGFTGTICQKLISHPFLMKIFPELERAENESAAKAQAAEGSIPTFIGGLYHGIINRETGANSSPGPNHLDSTGIWLILTAEDFQQTDDRDYLIENKQVIENCYEFLQSRMISEIQIPHGGASIDDYPDPQIFSYQASVYLATLNAVKIIAKALDDEELHDKADDQFKKTSRDFVKYLWNGQFFSYGCDPDGSNERDRMMFTGQLTGQFINKCLHWPDTVPFEMVEASAVAQLKTSVASWPEHYAPKVFDLDSFSSIDRLGTHCWPFYLEAGTGMLAFQAGYIQDCYEIMADIQDAHAKRGYSWSQNLWVLSELVYMSSPVSWFITDIMSSGGLDVGAETLYISPILDKQYVRHLLPMYFPGFWAEIYCDQESKSMTLKILECFDHDIAISRLGVDKPGKASSEIQFINVEPFKIKKGLQIDLSEHWDELVVYPQQPCILADPGRVLLRTVENPYRK